MASITATKITSPVNVEHRKGLSIRAGDTVRVWTKVVEKGKTRLQPFEGLVLARKHGSEPGATFTVRRVSNGVGVERIFPLYSPNIEKIELVKRAKTRRAKLYYIRQKAAKQIRRKMKGIAGDIPVFAEEPAGEEPEVSSEGENSQEGGEEIQEYEGAQAVDTGGDKEDGVEEEGGRSEKPPTGEEKSEKSKEPEEPEEPKSAEK